MGGRGSGGARRLQPEFRLLALAVSDIRTASIKGFNQHRQGRLDNFNIPRSVILIGFGSSLQFFYSLGLMIPLGYDHLSRRFIQSYYARVDSIAINSAPRRKQQYLRRITHYKHKNGLKKKD